MKPSYNTILKALHDLSWTTEAMVFNSLSQEEMRHPCNVRLSKQIDRANRLVSRAKAKPQT